MKNGKVSVIVPVYNVEEYVGKCIESIINQTYTNLEILINNDGSTDNSYEICKFYAEKDARIKLFTQKNNGVSACRNRMLDVATGDYILFVDSDDWLLPEHIERLVTLLEENNVDAVCCGYRKTTANNICIRKHKWKQIIADGIWFAKKMTSYVETYRCFPWGRLIRKELWDGIYFPVGRTYYEDMYTMPEVVLKAKSLIYTNEPLYVYRIRKTSSSHGKFELRKTDSLDGCITITKLGIENNCNAVIGTSARFFIMEYIKFRIVMLLNGNNVYGRKRGGVLQRFRIKYSEYFYAYLCILVFGNFQRFKSLFYKDLASFR